MSNMPYNGWLNSGEEVEVLGSATWAGSVTGGGAGALVVRGDAGETSVISGRIGGGGSTTGAVAWE